MSTVVPRLGRIGQCCWSVLAAHRPCGGVFSSVWFQRTLLPSSHQRRPSLFLSGDAGIGKTWLLRELQERAGKLLPALRIFRGGGDACLRELYRTAGGMDDLSDEELRVLPVLPRAGSLGGVEGLVDDPEAMWLTKSAGVRIVHVVSSGGSSDDERRPHRLRGLQPEDQAKLSAAVGVPLHENPLCTMLQGARREQRRGRRRKQKVAVSWLACSGVQCVLCPCSRGSASP